LGSSSKELGTDLLKDERVQKGLQQTVVDVAGSEEVREAVVGLAEGVGKSKEVSEALVGLLAGGMTRNTQQCRTARSSLH
jgi:hypothetical protein